LLLGLLLCVVVVSVRAAEHQSPANVGKLLSVVLEAIPGPFRLWGNSIAISDFAVNNHPLGSRVSTLFLSGNSHPLHIYVRPRTEVSYLQCGIGSKESVWPRLGQIGRIGRRQFAVGEYARNLNRFREGDYSRHTFASIDRDYVELGLARVVGCHYFLSFYDDPRPFGIDEGVGTGFGGLRALAHLCGGKRHFTSLIRNSQASEGSYYYQPPIGPFEGCVPMWRAVVGCLCLCCGFLAVVKGNGGLSVIGGVGLVLGGTFVWLTGNSNCDSAQKHNGEQSVHGGESVTQKYLTSSNYRNTVIDMANVLNKDRQIAIIGALAEGSSIRSIERLTGVHRDTIMRLSVRVGQGCANLQDAKLRDLDCHYLQFDEIWGFIGKKQRHVRPNEDPRHGDVWTFCAIDAETKLVPAFRCGKRDLTTALWFVQDVKDRMRNRVQISSDALRSYVDAIDEVFGSEVDFGQIVKTYEHNHDQHPSTNTVRPRSYLWRSEP
jgi:hypothetical protein